MVSLSLEQKLKVNAANTVNIGFYNNIFSVVFVFMTAFPPVFFLIACFTMGGTSGGGGPGVGMGFNVSWPEWAILVSLFLALPSIVLACMHLLTLHVYRSVQPLQSGVREYYAISIVVAYPLLALWCLFI